MLTSYTNKPENFKYLDQYISILNNIVDKKTDYLWKNYVDFKFEEQAALTVGLENDKVKVISSIINKDIWPKGVYRLMNRYFVDEDYRDTNTRTHKGKGYNIGHIILDDQMKYLKDNLDYNFLSNDRYWICNSTRFNCCQVLVYENDNKIPFQKG